MKKKTKLIFILSFLPYIVLIIISFYHAIFGYDVCNFLGMYIKTEYGINAFIDSIFWNTLNLCVIPVLPIALIYQIVYIIISIVNKYKNN